MTYTDNGLVVRYFLSREEQAAVIRQSILPWTPIGESANEVVNKLERYDHSRQQRRTNMGAETGGSEFVVVETVVEGEALVGEIPDGASIPNVPFEQEPMPIERAQEVADILNSTDLEK